eukprot:4478569-Pleurochrysis_carterae.AAC.1
MPQLGFGAPQVRHFAGDVEYQVANFINKNTETMEAITRRILQALLTQISHEHNADVAMREAYMREHDATFSTTNI